MNTPTTIADAIRQLVKTDNDAPRLIAEALQEIPELGLIHEREYTQLEAAAANERARSAERIAHLQEKLDAVANAISQKGGNQ